MGSIPLYALGRRNKAFRCLHCGVVSTHHFGPESTGIGGLSTSEFFAACKCVNCEKICLWMDKKLIYPDKASVEPPNEDLSEDIKKLYDEAASILHKSSRAAAALLRVALEKLCREQGEENSSLSQNIELLKEKGEIPEEIYEAMTVVRVVGNQAVHPGKIEFESNETPEIVISLFEVINFIAENMITKKKRAKAIYEKVRPQEKSPAPK